MTFVLVVLKTEGATVISADGSGADGIRTWVLQFTGSWLLWIGECVGRRMHEDNEFLRQLGSAASRSSCQQVLCSYQHPHWYNLEDAPPYLLLSVHFHL